MIGLVGQPCSMSPGSIMPWPSPDGPVLQIMLPGTLGPLLMAVSWTVIISSSVGLFFLYKTTTADPGFIPTGCVWGGRELL